MSDAFPARQLSRRRFLTISASAATLALMPGAGFAAAPVHRWRGAGLGADAAILLAHPDERQAQRIFALCEGEIARLEKIFSLFRDDSALSRLNRDGRLAAPPLEMVSLLSTAARVHEASEGAFDPTVQPLWALYATHYAARPGAAGASLEAVRFEPALDQRPPRRLRALARQRGRLPLRRVADDGDAQDVRGAPQQRRHGVDRGHLGLRDLRRARGEGDALLDRRDRRARRRRWLVRTAVAVRPTIDRLGVVGAVVAAIDDAVRVVVLVGAPVVVLVAAVDSTWMRV